MKAFEKWWKEKGLGIYFGNYDSKNRNPEITAETAWKAALEWVLAQPDGSCGVRKCVPMEAIRDELEASDE